MTQPASSAGAQQVIAELEELARRLERYAADHPMLDELRTLAHNAGKMNLADSSACGDPSGILSATARITELYAAEDRLADYYSVYGDPSGILSAAAVQIALLATHCAVVSPFNHEVN